MEQRRRDLGAGEENKCPLVQPGMREGQGSGPENQGVVKKEIEIQGTLCPALVTHAAVLFLNAL